MRRVLVANRGEIAVRLVRGAADLGYETVAVTTSDEPGALHAQLADRRILLPGTGTAAYLDRAALVAAARESGADVVHPGYGFLSEDAGFARDLAAAGIVVAGPGPEVLEAFGDKTRARAAAVEHGLPVLPATDGPVDLAGAQAFLESLGPGAAVMVKALAGGGGRGMRPVHSPDALPEAMERCRSEAEQSFGDGRVYVEQLLTGARHIEVQVVGDGSAAVALGDRDCTLQRRRQKLVEFAPSPWLAEDLRTRLLEMARTLAEGVGYRGVGTVEFLVSGETVAFLEVNPRLQVEHTVTEEVTGVDLVATGLRIAGGATLAGLGLTTAPGSRGIAVQARVNAETLQADGTVRPGVGELIRFRPPAGRGVRVDTHGYPGYTVGPQFDSLLAKVVVTDPDGDVERLLRRLDRALGEFDIAGPPTTIPVLRELARRDEVRSGRIDTGFVEQVLPALVPDAPAAAPEVDAEKVLAPMAGVVVAIEAAAGTPLARGATVLVLESMKMEHLVTTPADGTLGEIVVALGDVVGEGSVLAHFVPGELDAAVRDAAEQVDPDAIRPDLAEVRARRAFGLDENRPAAVAKRRKTKHRTARENIEDLCEPGTFVEYGALTIAAQRRRRELDDLIENTMGDGMVTGIGVVDGRRCVVMSYDYMVLAGTQGKRNHAKTDRMVDLAERGKLPVILFAEGGGGRPGDSDTAQISGLDVPTFRDFARLSGRVPLIAIVSGRCFAGNAALAGCCDVLISTEDANLGMGGPAMIEGGGLGVVSPDEIGPMPVQDANGVVDVLVRDEAEAVQAARRYLAYFRDPAEVRPAEAPDQRLLRQAIPENRLRAYDVREVVDGLFDTGSVLELRPRFGHGVLTVLAELDGRPVGVIANNPRHLGGAIDSPASDKAARFLQLCDAFGLPVLSLCDTPGFMVGVASEETATVRHFSRMFVAGANLSVPVVALVLRKAYGLGAMAMLGGSIKAPFASFAWPTAEFGGMGLEGSVDLAHRKELAAIEDPDARRARRAELIAELYERGKGLSVASVFEIDDVIDPADTRAVLAATFAAAPRRTEAQRTFVDTW
ncbi:MAG: ATP-grasp domain-containing protein [Pseudonocardia sp.]|nr:ATP-grasp domain-containing protein [Pseudonocardia sp.]